MPWDQLPTLLPKCPAQLHCKHLAVVNLGRSSRGEVEDRAPEILSGTDGSFHAPPESFVPEPPMFPGTRPISPYRSARRTPARLVRLAAITSGTQDETVRMSVAYRISFWV